MIVDSSALLAILNREPDADLYETAIGAATHCRMSAANFLESAMVVESRGGFEAGNELDALLEAAEIGIEPVTAQHAAAARQAWRRFGKGRHRASLNFGDCFAYALSRTSREPLLYKGDDFSRTDIPNALAPVIGN